jgi:Tol biopolymer transport system component
MRFVTFRSAVLAIPVVLMGCGDSAAPESADASSSTLLSSGSTSGSTSIPSSSSAASTPFSETTAIEPGEEWLAYQEEFDGLQQIFLVRHDGGGRHQLAPGVAMGHQSNPDWSPDGQRLVFAAGNGSTGDLWVIDADGHNASLLLECVDPCVALDDPAWAPDGGSILFSRLSIESSGVTGTGWLELVDVDTGKISVLLTAPATDFVAGPRFSPDGTKVVLELVHTDGSAPFEQVTGVELVVLDLGVSPLQMRPITDAALFAATADWSPDGSTIVYSALVSPDASVPTLFAIHQDGTGRTQVMAEAEGKRSAEHPDYSHGGRVVFAGTIDVRGRLLMELDIATGVVSPAVGDAYVRGSHPRSRPVE